MAKPPVNTVGELLRKARETQRLSIDDAHKSTKISVHILSALEQDDFDLFESETYLRGFLKNYATFLKLDIDSVNGTLDRQRGRIPSGKETLWDIEETLSEERLKSPKILSRIIVPLLLIIILILSFLLIRQYNANKQRDSGRRHTLKRRSAAACSPVAGCFFISDSTDEHV